MIDNEPTIKTFGEEIDTSETTKDRLKRIYNEMAIKQWFKSIEEFYVKKKMMLLMSDGLEASDEKMIKLLQSIASDLWYNGSTKEFVMWNNLANLWNWALGK